MKEALIIIDIQNDFTAGGSLEVPEANEIIPAVNALQNHFEHIVATQDWHPAGHGSFASSHEDRQPFDIIDLHGLEQVLWPDHCVQESPGAEFHPELETGRIQAIFRKGMDPAIDSYSGFYDNGRRRSTGLSNFLKGLDISHLHFCGLAADYCVYYSIKDALREGFRCTLYKEFTKAVDPGKLDTIEKELRSQGVEII